MVSADELLRHYPDIKLEEDGGFEQVREIKERAFGRRVRERMLPSQEILSQRFYEQSLELAGILGAPAPNALDNFRYTAVAGGGAQDLVAAMAKSHADLAAFDVYLAGPEAFVDAAEKALAQQGFPAAQLVATAT